MPEHRFRGWQYMEKREPFGDRRLDFIAGMITSGIRNAWLNENQPGFSVSDFMHDWDESINKEPDPVERVTAMQVEYENLMRFKEGYERQRRMRDETN